MGDTLVERLCQVDICGVFSPPRVGTDTNKYALQPGEAMYRTTGWDVNLKSHRDLAEPCVDEKKPLAIIGSPPCTPFSQLQTLSPDSEAQRVKWDDGGPACGVRGAMVLQKGRGW